MTAFKPKTRSVKTQTLIDATSSFFCEMRQPLPASEWTPEILPANAISFPEPAILLLRNERLWDNP